MGALSLDGLRWGAVVGAGVPLLTGLVAATFGGSPGVILIGGVLGLVGAAVGALIGFCTGLAAGLLFELWTLSHVPAPVVALGTVLPVLAVLYAISVGSELVAGWAQLSYLSASGPLVADVTYRARRLERDRDRGPQCDAQAQAPQDTRS